MIVYIQKLLNEYGSNSPATIIKRVLVPVVLPEAAASPGWRRLNVLTCEVVLALIILKHLNLIIYL